MSEESPSKQLPNQAVIAIRVERRGTEFEVVGWRDDSPSALREAKAVSRRRIPRHGFFYELRSFDDKVLFRGTRADPTGAYREVFSHRDDPASRKEDHAEGIVQIAAEPAHNVPARFWLHIPFHAGGARVWIYSQAMRAIFPKLGPSQPAGKAELPDALKARLKETTRNAVS